MNMRFDWDGGTVSGARHEMDGPADAVLVLAHGAGKDMDDPLLVGLGDRLAGHGISVVRFRFPYREAGRKAPGPQAASEACYRAVAEAVRGEAPLLVLGGKSYGGRMASHIVADGTAADGLVFLGYPLHPPGKPDRLRDEHLGRVRCPMLWVQGSRDPFARPDLLEATLSRLPDALHVPVDGGDHSLKVRGRSQAEVLDDVAGRIAGFVSGRASPSRPHARGDTARP